jgi:hypothetical protein
MTEKEKTELEQYRQAEKEGYIKRCKCGSIKIHVYTDEDYFTDMTRCICHDCKKNFPYSD